MECDSSYSEFSGVCGAWEGQASGLRLRYTEACYECLAGRAKGLPWNPKAISPSSCWMNCDVKDPGMYLDMERGLEDISACPQFISGKRRPEICASISPYASAPSQTGPRSEYSRKLSTLSIT